MNEQKDIKGLLKEKFEHYEADPGVDLWAAIDAEVHPERKRRGAWWMYAAVAASVTILFFSLFWLLKEPVKGSAQDQIVETETREDAPALQENIPQKKLAKTSPETEHDSEIKSNPQVAEIEEQEENKSGVVGPDKNLHQEAVADRNVSKNRNSADRPKAEKDPKLADYDEYAALSVQTMSPANFPMTEDIVQPETQKVNPTRTRPQNSTNQVPAHFASNKKSINLNDLSVDDAVSFASNTLENWKKSPVEVYREKSEDGEVKTYQVDLFNLKITKKTHRKVLKKL